MKIVEAPRTRGSLPRSAQYFGITNVELRVEFQTLLQRRWVEKRKHPLCMACSNAQSGPPCCPLLLDFLLLAHLLADG